LALTSVALGSHRRCPNSSRDFVPWRVSDAGKPSAS
jgi:hypothetical protein